MAVQLVQIAAGIHDRLRLAATELPKTDGACLYAPTFESWAAGNAFMVRSLLLHEAQYGCFRLTSVSAMRMHAELATAVVADAMQLLNSLQEHALTRDISSDEEDFSQNRSFQYAMARCMSAAENLCLAALSIESKAPSAIEQARQFLKGGAI